MKQKTRGKGDSYMPKPSALGPEHPKPTPNLLSPSPQAWELMLEAPALGPPAPAAATTATTATAAAAAASATEAAAAAVPGPRYADGAISWRGDGKFFAVVCRDAAVAAAAATEAAPPPPYHVRIWDRTTLEPHSAGEPFDCLLPLPAWQPNGRHLYVAAAGATAAAVSAGAPAPPSAAVAWGGDSGSSGGGSGTGSAVLMYERNGLRHGGFALPGSGKVWEGGL